MKLLVKITSIFLIFISPLIIIFNRYQAQEVEKIETQIGLVPTIFVIVIALIGLWFASQQFMYMVKQDKFGLLSIVFFGIVLGLSLFISWFSINNIVLAAQNNLNQFVETFTYHKDTLYYMLISIVSGISIPLIYKLTKIKTT